MPEEYERPKDPARLKDLHTKRRTVVPLSLGGTYVRGQAPQRQRFPEREAPLKVEKLEEELPFEARLHMALVQCASAVRGRMTADIELWARLSKDLLPHEDALLTVNEALGSDRAGRRYWILSGDYSTVFVETPPPLDAPLGAQSQWQRLRNSAHLERLRAALDPHGRAESVLLESLGLRWELLTAAMDKAQLQGAPEGEAGGGGVVPADPAAPDAAAADAGRALGEGFGSVCTCAERYLRGKGVVARALDVLEDPGAAAAAAACAEEPVVISKLRRDLLLVESGVWSLKTLPRPLLSVLWADEGQRERWRVSVRDAARPAALLECLLELISRLPPATPACEPWWNSVPKPRTDGADTRGEEEQEASAAEVALLLYGFDESVRYKVFVTQSPLPFFYQAPDSTPSSP